MKSDYDPIDRSLRDALQRKFEKFEKIPDQAVDKKVVKDLRALLRGRALRRFSSATYFVLIFGGLLWWYSHDQEKAVPNDALGNTAELGVMNQKSTPNQVSNPPALRNQQAGIAPSSIDLRNSPAIKKTAQEVRKPSAKDIRPDAASEYVQNAGAQKQPYTSLPLPSQTTPNSRLIQAFDYQNIAPRNTKPSEIDLVPAIPDWRYFEPSTSIAQKEKRNQDKRSGLSPVLSFTGINTFQNVIVLAQQEARLQNVELPVRIQNLGFIAEAGFQKSGFQFLVGLTHFDQHISYEIATDEYLLKEGEDGVLTPKRKGVAVAEHVRFGLLGLSLKKKFYFKSPSQRALYAQVGASFQHDLNSSFNSGWVQFGAGRNLKISDKAVLSVGPYAGYTLNRMGSTSEAFRFRPLQIGLTTSFTLNRD